MQSELDVIRGMYSAFARGDVASVLAALAPEIVWIEAEGFPSGGTYTTPDAVLHKVFMRLSAEWDAFGAVPHEFVSQGQTVVAIGDYSGT
jgi:ketosteroid isomerase-like protein